MPETTTRKQRDIRRLLQTEARWLQRVRFGLKKAQEARRKLSEVQGGPLEPLPIDIGGHSETLAAIEACIASRAEALTNAMQEDRMRIRRRRSDTARGRAGRSGAGPKPRGGRASRATT